ncbi:hypothetical protein AAH678_11460 [Sodalis endosymbiont of Spalangia cameroni]|uniref:hypothetical protein n=1 Tax=Sodalis praecaptivus TaxID=1239307 RepID=UPI0031FA2C30
MNDKPTLKEIILNILAKADGLMTKDIVDAVSYELGRQVRMDTIVVTAYSHRDRSVIRMTIDHDFA